MQDSYLYYLGIWLMKYSHSYAISFSGGHFGSPVQVRILQAMLGDHLEYANYYIIANLAYQSYFITNVFLGPYNVQIGTKIIIFGRLAVEI